MIGKYCIEYNIQMQIYYYYVALNVVNLKKWQYGNSTRTNRQTSRNNR